MKPICKSESGWLFWREENPNCKNKKKGFSKWAKNQMNRCKRRYFKKEIFELENRYMEV